MKPHNQLHAVVNIHAIALSLGVPPLICGEGGGLSGLDAARFLFLSVVPYCPGIWSNLTYKSKYAFKLTLTLSTLRENISFQESIAEIRSCTNFGSLEEQQLYCNSELTVK